MLQRKRHTRNDNPDTRICLGCDTEKPLTDFCKKTGGYKGTDTYCKPCKARQQREREAARRGVVRLEEIARFWSRVDKNGPVFADLGPCWIWTGPPRKRDGYGAVHFAGRNVSPHLVSLALAGRVAPEGLPFADHMCRRPLCCNPAHLRYVTPRTNALENNDSPHAQYARRPTCDKGHLLEGENLALYVRKGYTTRHGNKSDRVTETRVCLTCRPHYWRWAVIPRQPPPGARKLKRYSEGHK